MLKAIKLYEDFYNNVMYEEREKFLKNDKENRANGYNKRKLKYQIDMTLNLKIPTMRKNNKELKFSVLQKYKRTSPNFDKKIKSLYGSRSFERDICEILNISTLPRKTKEKIHREYMNKYRAFINMKKSGYDLIKLDATFFGKVKSVYSYTAYFVWGFKNGEKHCLYYYVQNGSENKEGWKTVIDYILEKINLSDVKLIVSDLFPALKKLLEKELPFIPRQNCMFHRFEGLSRKIKKPWAYKKGLVKKSYAKLLEITEREELVEVLDVYRNFDRVARKRNGREKYSKQDVQKMLNVSYEDNFTFLEVEEELQNYSRKELIQAMDIESVFSDMKFHLKKNFKYNTCEELIVKIFFFLERKNYLPS